MAKEVSDEKERKRSKARSTGVSSSSEPDEIPNVSSHAPNLTPLTPRTPRTPFGPNPREASLDTDPLKDNQKVGSPAEKPSIEAVFEANESALLHFAHGYVKRRSVAEEMVQESFLRLHRQWAVIEHPRAWLYRCVRNLSLNHLRKYKRETVIPLPDTDTLPTVSVANFGGSVAVSAASSPGSAPDEALLAAEALGMVRELLAELPAADQQLLRLKYHEDQSYQHIAEALDIGVGNVGYRLHHLLKHLASSLAAAGITHPSD